jgi:putative oxidoreductase
MQSTRSFLLQSSEFSSADSSSCSDLGALLIAVTVILAGIIFHAFWKETDATAKMNEQIAFNKDLALGGAALILFALVASGTISGSDFGPHVGNISFFSK